MNLSDFYHYTKMDMPTLGSAIPLDTPPQAKYHLFNLILLLFAVFIRMWVASPVF